MERRLNTKENGEFQLQLQAGMEQRVLRNSTRLDLERLLSRPQQLQVYSDGSVGRVFRRPLKESRIGSEDVLPTPRRRASDDSPTGSINLISFAEETEQATGGGGAGLPTRRGSIQMESSNYGRAEDEKLRKTTVLELKKVFSRRCTAEVAPNVSDSYLPSSGETGVRNGYRNLRKSSVDQQRQDSESPASIGTRNVSSEEVSHPASEIVAPASVSENSSLGELPTTNNMDLEMTASATSSVSSENVAQDNQEGNLKVSEKVVWIMGRNRAENGVLMWIGDIGGIQTAGVLFDNPVGNTDGFLKGIRYFICAPKHGGFLPITALIKYNDYYCVHNAEAQAGYSKSSMFDSTTKNDDPKEYPPSELSTVSDGEMSELNKRLLDDEEDNVIICAICQDPLLMSINFSEYVQSSQSDEGMVSTYCGHLFHAICLNKWFHMKPSLTTQECPYCKKTMDISSTIRIFPVLGKP